MTREHGGCDYLRKARKLAATRKLPVGQVDKVAKLYCPNCPKDGRCKIIEAEGSNKALRQEALTNFD